MSSDEPPASRASKRPEPEGARDAELEAGGSRASSRARDVAVGLGVVVLAFFFYVLSAGLVLGFAPAIAGGALSEAQQAMVEPPALAFGVFTAAGVYFVHSRHDASFLDVRRPDRRAALWVAGGVAVLVALNYVVGYLYELLEVPAPEHGTVQIVQAADPVVVAYFVAVSVLLIGPSEELLFRNVLQKRLSESFTWVGAVAVSSAIFAVAHTAAYFTEDPLQVAGSLLTVFALSLVLGYVYERTASLPVVALIHGLYDAVLFALIYFGIGV